MKCYYFYLEEIILAIVVQVSTNTTLSVHIDIGKLDDNLLTIETDDCLSMRAFEFVDCHVVGSNFTNAKNDFF